MDRNRRPVKMKKIIIPKTESVFGMLGYNFAGLFVKRNKKLFWSYMAKKLLLTLYYKEAWLNCTSKNIYRLFGVLFSRPGCISYIDFIYAMKIHFARQDVMR